MTTVTVRNGIDVSASSRRSRHPDEARLARFTFRAHAWRRDARPPTSARSSCRRRERIRAAPSSSKATSRLSCSDATPARTPSALLAALGFLLGYANASAVASRSSRWSTSSKATSTCTSSASDEIRPGYRDRAHAACSRGRATGCRALHVRQQTSPVRDVLANGVR
jgi:hypothetical protein